MKAKILIEFLQNVVNKNPDAEVQIIIPEEDFERIREAREEILYDISINEEEKEDFVETGLVPIFLGISRVSLNRIEIILGNPDEPGTIPSWKKLNIIPLSDKIRPFFPGYKIPFIIETDVGEILTHVASARAGNDVGSNTGRYLAKGLSKWYKKHSELGPGSRIVFDILESGKRKRYRMSIPKEEPRA